MTKDESAKAVELGQKAMCAMLGFYDLTLALAAPKVIARAVHIPARDGLLSVIDDYVGLIAHAKRTPRSKDSDELLTNEPHVIRLRALVDAWTPSRDVPTAIREQARAILAAMNVKEPPEGWDNYEGEPENESGAIPTHE